MQSYPIGFPQKISEWKGKTLFQVISSIKKNSSSYNDQISVNQIRKSMPLKIFRKEIHNLHDDNENNQTNCRKRFNSIIRDIDMPGSTIVSEIPHDAYSNSLVTTLNNNQTTLSAENGACNTPDNCFSPAYNARKRLRSAGMIRKNFNINKKNDTYNTSTQQYLTSRNKTIKQNEFHYFRKGDASLIPGPGLASNNVYSPAGLSHCNDVNVENLLNISASKNNNKFSYFINEIEKFVIIEDGIYTDTTLNDYFITIQNERDEFVVNYNDNKYFVFNIIYINKQFVLQVMTRFKEFNNYLFGYGGGYIEANIKINLGNNFANLIGFLPGTYDYNTISNNVEYINNNKIEIKTFRGANTRTNYVPLYYKPNNPLFCVQGAVDSSARIQRLKYNTITKSAFSVENTYGTAVANALAYGVSEQAYTAKTVVGDKPKCTPVINKNGTICKKRFIYRK